MRTRKIFFLVFISVFLITGNFLNANTVVCGRSEDCADLLSAKKIYTPYENDIAHSIAGLTQKAINEGILTLGSIAAALAQENYDISKVAAKGYEKELSLFLVNNKAAEDVQPTGVLRFVEKIFALTNLPDESRTHIGKLVLLKLIDIQANSNHTETDQLWTRLSAARVLNALIRDRVILSRQFTDIVLEEAARELNVGEVYPGGHLHLNKKMENWIRDGRWDQKTDELKRIAFFVTEALKHQTQDFSNYDFLINFEKSDKHVFYAFINELVQPMIIDTLELALAVRHDRLLSARDSLKVAGTNAAATGLMVAGTQAFLIGDVPSVAAMAAGGAICAAALMWGDTYAHFKGWLAQRRLAMYWKESIQQQCH